MAAIDRAELVRWAGRQAASGWKAASQKGASHWLGVTAAFATVLLIGALLERQPWFQQIRFRVYDALVWSSAVDRSRDHFKEAVVVHIDDEYYDNPQLAKRSPLNKFYLASLVDQCVAEKARAIVLDVELGTHPYKNYESETAALRKAILRAVAAGIDVILVVPLMELKDGGYERHDTVLQDLERNPRVHFAHALRAIDPREVDLDQKIVNGPPVPSIAAATALVIDPKSLRRKQNKQGFVVATFVKSDETPFRSDEFLAGKIPGETIEHHAVIIGGNWHRSELRAGERIDQHDTPAGIISGSMLHANYTEALLFGAIRMPVSHGAMFGLEAATTYAVAFLFCLVTTVRGRSILVAALLVVLMLISSAVWQNVGAFFDCSIILGSLALHGVVERLKGESLASHPLVYAAIALFITGGAFAAFQHLHPYRYKFEPAAASVAKLVPPPPPGEMKVLTAIKLPATTTTTEAATPPLANQATVFPSILVSREPVPEPPPAVAPPRSSTVAPPAEREAIMIRTQPPSVPPEMPSHSGLERAADIKLPPRTATFDVTPAPQPSPGPPKPPGQADSTPSFPLGVGPVAGDRVSGGYDVSVEPPLSGGSPAAPRISRPADDETGMDGLQRRLWRTVTTRRYQPVLADGTVTLLLMRQSFDASGAPTANTRDALAVVADELRHDSDLQVKLVGRDARRLDAVAGLLEEKGVDAKRIIRAVQWPERGGADDVIVILEI